MEKELLTSYKNLILQKCSMQDYCSCIEHIIDLLGPGDPYTVGFCYYPLYEYDKAISKLLSSSNIIGIIKSLYKNPVSYSIHFYGGIVKSLRRLDKNELLLIGIICCKILHIS